MRMRIGSRGAIQIRIVRRRRWRLRILRLAPTGAWCSDRPRFSNKKPKKKNSVKNCAGDGRICAVYFVVCTLLSILWGFLVATNVHAYLGFVSSLVQVIHAGAAETSLFIRTANSSRRPLSSSAWRTSCCTPVTLGAAAFSLTACLTTSCQVVPLLASSCVISSFIRRQTPTPHTQTRCRSARTTRRHWQTRGRLRQTRYRHSR